MPGAAVISSSPAGQRPSTSRDHFVRHFLSLSPNQAIAPGRSEWGNVECAGLLLQPRPLHSRPCAPGLAVCFPQQRLVPVPAAVNASRPS